MIAGPLIKVWAREPCLAGIDKHWFWAQCTTNELTDIAVAASEETGEVVHEVTSALAITRIKKIVAEDAGHRILSHIGTRLDHYRAAAESGRRIAASENSIVKDARPSGCG